MNLALIQGAGKVELVERPDPPVGPGQVAVAVGACGVCALEQRAYRGLGRGYPFAGGHEVGGTVIGAPGGELEPGEVVAVSLLPRCGKCVACRQGRDNLCAYLSEYAEVHDGPAGFSQRVLADAADVVPLGGARTVLEAALVEPLACVLNSLRVAGVDAGTRVAIVGNGVMGVLHARAAEAIGASPVVFETDPAPAGLEQAWGGEARSLEAEGTRLADAGLVGMDPEFDAAILIRRVAESLPLCGKLTRPGGVVSVFASLPAAAEISMPSRLLRTKELMLTAAASHRREDFHRAASMVGNSDLEVADLVHRSFPLGAIESALDYSIGHDTGRVMIVAETGEGS